MIRLTGTIFAGLLGLAFGSFLNVCVSRWPAGESVVKPRSHCRACGRMLAWWENVPLVSWIALRGRCRTCGVWIGWRYPVVELAVGGLWAAVSWRFLGRALEPDFPAISPFLHWNLYNETGLAIGMLIFYWFLIALAVLDAENLWLPDALTLPGIGLGLILTVAYRAVEDRYSDGPSGSSLMEACRAAIGCAISIALAAGLILLIRWIYWLARRREGIGLGDAKLMAMLGAWLGFSGALLAFGLAVILGSVLALVLLARRREQNEDSWAAAKLPLGTFLCIGGIVSGLWGERMIDAYLRWAGF